MKLTEAVILMESFRDLRAVLEQVYDYRELRGTREVANFLLVYSEGTDLFDDIPDVRMNDVDSIVNLIRWFIKHPFINRANGILKDTGKWISVIKNQGVKFMVVMMTALMERFNEYAKDPSTQKPKIVTIKKTSNWEVYRLDNYSAARFVCNKFNTNFCIGSSTTHWFNTYGKDKNRETFAITLTNNTVVIVHAGDGFLITSHDNKSDFSDRGTSRGEGIHAIAKDFSSAGVSVEGMLAALSVILPRSEVTFIKNSLSSDGPANRIYEHGGFSIAPFSLAGAVRGVSFHSPYQTIYVAYRGDNAVLVSDSPDFDNQLKMDGAGLVRYLEGMGMQENLIRMMGRSAIDYGVQRGNFQIEEIGDILLNEVGDN